MANTFLVSAAAPVIVYEFLWQLAILTAPVVGIYILWENIREVRR